MHDPAIERAHGPGERDAERAQEQALYILMPGGVGYAVYRDNIGGVTAENYNPMYGFSQGGTLWKNLTKS